MTPSRPYLIRALYEWISDNGFTPYIMVDANFPGTVVPTRFVENGVITLNVSQTATKDLRLGNDAIEFQARFGSKIFHLYLPIPAVSAIFAHETNRGMEFSEQDIENYDDGSGDGGGGEGSPTAAPKDKPHLELVE